MNGILDLSGLKPRVRATPFRTVSRAFCPRCQKPVDLTAIAETARFYKTDPDDVRALIQNVILHPIHNNRGELMICGESLFSYFSQRKTQLLDAGLVSQSSRPVC